MRKEPSRISYVQYFSTNWMYVRHYKRPIILDTLLYHCLNKKNIACWWYIFEMYSATCFEIYYSITDAYDLSTDLLQVRMLCWNCWTALHINYWCVSSALDIFIFNKIGFFERETEGRNAMKIPPISILVTPCSASCDLVY